MPLPLWPTPADLVFSSEGDLPNLRVRARSLLLLAAFAFLLYLSRVPSLLRTSSPPTGDQPFYLMDAISLVQDGDLDVSNNFANRDEDAFYSRAPHPRGFTGQSAPYPLPPHLIASPARPASEWYDYHAPGLGILLVPAWIVGSWFHLWWPATVVFMCLLGSLVGVNIFLLAFQATGDNRVAWMVWTAMSFSAPVMCYSMLIFTEVPASLLILYAFRRFSVGWGANRPWQLALAGICVAYIPWLSWRCGAIAAALGLYGAVRWWRFHRFAQTSGARHAATAAFLLVPVLLSVLAIAGYGHFLTGKWLPDIRYRAGGSIDAFHWPWHGGRDLTLFVSGAVALLFDQQWGLLVYSPVYLLVFVGLLAMLRPGRNAEHRQLAWLASLSVPYLVVISAFDNWGGAWCPPGRYLTPLIPLFALPLARSLHVLIDVRLYRIVFVLLTLLGCSYMLIVSRDFHLLWPAGRHGYFWASASQWLPGGLDLRRYIPAFAWPDERRSVKTAWIFGSTTALVLLFHALMPPGDPARRRLDRLRGRATAWVCTFVLVSIVWLLVNPDSPLARGVGSWLRLRL